MLGGGKYGGGSQTISESCIQERNEMYRNPQGRDLSASLGVSVFEVMMVEGRELGNNVTRTHLTSVVAQARQVGIQ